MDDARGTRDLPRLGRRVGGEIGDGGATRVVRAWPAHKQAPVVPPGRSGPPLPPEPRAAWPEPRLRPVLWRVRRVLATTGAVLAGLLAFGFTLAVLGAVTYALRS